MGQMNVAPMEAKPMVLAMLWQRIYGAEAFDHTRPIRDLAKEVEVGIAMMQAESA